MFKGIILWASKLLPSIITFIDHKFFSNQCLQGKKQYQVFVMGIWSVLKYSHASYIIYPCDFELYVSSQIHAILVHTKVR